jgi:putative nucleotidyltransferase with HDIG domain
MTTADSTSAALAETMTKVIKARVEAGRLVLPALPEVAAKTLELLRRPDQHMKAITDLLEKDPVLVAQLVKLGSSAAYAGTENVTSIRQVVARLGTQKLSVALTEAVAHRVFVSNDSRIRSLLEQIWLHSQTVAGLARDIAALSKGIDADAAYLGGLLHDVGKPVVALMLLEAEKSLKVRWISAESWISVVNSTHREIGIQMTESWRMPDAVQRAVRDCSEYDPGDRNSVANVVRLANSVAKLNGVYPGTFDKDDAEAMVMIGRSVIGIDEAVLLRLSSTVGGKRAAS